MTGLRWAVIAFIAGASLTNLAGRYKDHVSVGWMPPRGEYSEGFSTSNAFQGRHRIYRAALVYESFILLIGLPLLFVPQKSPEIPTRAHWVSFAFILVATIVNAIHTRDAYQSRGWVPPHGYNSSGLRAAGIRDAWHRHVNVSGVERELGIGTIGCIGVLLWRTKRRP